MCALYITYALYIICFQYKSMIHTLVYLPSNIHTNKKTLFQTKQKPKSSKNVKL